MSKFSLYVIGFVASALLTLGAYFAVTAELFSGGELVIFIMMLAIVQLVVQIVCFLHIGEESGPRWNLISLLLTISFILVIVIGSLWIMGNLNHNMMFMPSSEIDTYFIDKEGIYR